MLRDRNSRLTELSVCTKLYIHLSFLRVFAGTGAEFWSVQGLSEGEDGVLIGIRMETMENLFEQLKRQLSE